MTGERAALVEAAAASWAALLRADDTADDTAEGADELDLTDADPVARETLLAGRSVRLRSLVRDRTLHTAALRRLLAIRDRARDFHEERGLAVGSLAVGVAAWPELGDRPAIPVLRRPLRITARNASEDDVDLEAGPAGALHPLLVEKLAAYGLPPDPAMTLDALRDAKVRGLMLSDRVVVGTLAEVGARSAADLESSAELLAASDVVAALAGDAEAAAALGPPLTLQGDGPDRRDPAAEFLVLDADPEQTAAGHAVLAGQHLAIEGGPGSGRSATVVALVGALVATGRRVLVVAEKRAALETVLDRLEAVGLADVVVDAADEPASRQRIRAASTAAGQPPGAGPDHTALQRRVAEARDRLREHACALHDLRTPWGVSVYAAQTALLGLPPQAESRVRLRGEPLAALAGEVLTEARAVVREWAALGGAALTAVDTPWYGARISTPEQARDARAAAATLAESTYPEVRARLERTLAEAGLAPAPSVADWADALGLLGAVAETERLLSPSVWEAPLAELVAATADRNWRREHDDRMGLRARTSARREAQALWRGARPQREEVHDALRAAAEQVTAWSRRALRRGAPRTVRDLDPTRAAYAALRTALTGLQDYLADRDLAALTPAVLDKTLRGLAADPALERLPRLAELSGRAAALGLRPLLLELTARRVPVDLAPSVLESAWLTSLLEHIAATDLRYGDFDGAAMRETAAEFRAADAEHIAATGARVRRRAAERLAAAVESHPAQAVEAGVAADLRGVLDVAPDVALAAAPCWVMSPLAVPALLPPEQLFDVVIFEEANLVPVPHAVAALARGRVAVLVGDRRQLPPVELHPGPGAPPASVLDVLAPLLPTVTLRTCHRRCDERLVGFAAATRYAGGLRTVPSANPTDPVRHVPVPHRIGTPGQEESVTAEVQKVVGLVIDHAIRRPQETFGVVTVGALHAERIAAALRVALVGRPELADVFRGDARERFFVKPCTRVQADVRDVIFFSPGFGKTGDGVPAYRFGTLDADGGERLLTVGLTRARRQLTVIAALAGADLDPARLHSNGARLLRAALGWAESPERRRTPYAAPPAPDSFHLDLRHRLRAAGLPVVTEVGIGSARIDLALAHPTDAERLVLAIVTDGPRSPSTVRARERLYPEHLEALGWTLHRVYSMDWFREPDREVARISAAYDAAVARLGGSAAVSRARPAPR